MYRVLLAVLVYWFVGGTAHAATLYLDPSEAALKRGDSVPIAVRVDTDERAGECINAVDAVITYSPSVVPVDVSVGDSIFSVWVEPPIIDQEARTISFAGGIPNGYCGRIPGDPRLTNTIATIIFRSPSIQIGVEKADQGEVSFKEETAVYLNDGRGTRVSPLLLGTTLSLSREGGQGTDPWLDRVAADSLPPEEFSISLQQDDQVFGGRYFIVFNTTDKQTGIDHYEIMEEPISELGDIGWAGVHAPWVRDRSPYVLKDQTLNSTIRVRAIDKAGNEYVATLVPDPELRGERPRVDNNPLVLVGLLSGIALMVVIALVLWWRRRTQTTTPTVTSSTQIAHDDE